MIIEFEMIEWSKSLGSEAILVRLEQVLKESNIVVDLGGHREYSQFKLDSSISITDDKRII